MNSAQTNKSGNQQRIGIMVFLLAVVCTAALIAMGLNGTPWPKWLLGLTTLL